MKFGCCPVQSSSRKSAPTAPSAGPYVPVGFSSPQAPSESISDRKISSATKFYRTNPQGIDESLSEHAIRLAYRLGPARPVKNMARRQLASNKCSVFGREQSGLPDTFTNQRIQNTRAFWHGDSKYCQPSSAEGTGSKCTGHSGPR